MSDKTHAAFHGAGPSFTETLRAAADTVADPIAGMLTAAAWHLDRMARLLAQAKGLPEGTVRITEGLGLNGQEALGRPESTPDGQTPVRPVYASETGQGRAESGRITPMGSARIAPTGSTDPADWYSLAGWEHRDDAHRVTFEGESA